MIRITRSFSRQTAAAAYERDALAVQPADLAIVSPAARHVVALREGGNDVEWSRDRLGGTRHAPGGGQDVARSDQRLRRNASPVGALSPDQLPLDDGDRQVVIGTASRRRFARRSGADDDDIHRRFHRITHRRFQGEVQARGSTVAEFSTTATKSIH